MVIDKEIWSAFLERTGVPTHSDIRALRVPYYGYPIITTGVLELLQRYVSGQRVLELGAGTGYLAFQLSKTAASVKAVDLQLYDFVHYSTWCHVAHEDALAQDYNAYDVFVLSWPDWKSDFAFEVARRIPVGKTLLYQGELRGGYMGESKFFDLLRDCFKPATVLNERLAAQHVTYKGFKDRWIVATRVA